MVSGVGFDAALSELIVGVGREHPPLVAPLPLGADYGAPRSGYAVNSVGPRVFVAPARISDSLFA